MFIFKKLKISKFIFSSLYLSHFLQQNVVSNERIKWEKQNESFEGEKIKWEKLNKSFEGEKIKWELISEDSIPKVRFNSNKFKTLTFQEKINLSKPKNNSALYLGPFIFSNSFLKKGYFSHNLKQKSSFSGGDAKGSGNQNYSYALNYAYSDESIISGIISEADDPLYNKILNNPIKKNYWRNYAIVLNKKLFSNKKNNIDLSLNASLEYWDMETYYKKTDNTITYGNEKKILGSLAFPLTKGYKDIYLSLSPRISIIPDSLGLSKNNKNFYGNNYSLSTALGADIFTNTTLEATYTLLYGKSKNTFDNDLNFSKNNIYSYGISWNPNSIVNLKIGITNSFGLTPATSLLTIPSANLDIYEFKLTLRPDHRDTLRSLNSYEKQYSYDNGLTVNNALIPIRSTNQFYTSIDNNGSISGFYGYSISNIFQIEFANLALIKNANIEENKSNKKLKNTFFSEGNINNRFGGTINLFSPEKGDTFWMSIRTTLGRDQNSVQGYLFSEMLSTFQIKDNLKLNISPKYAWSGIKSTGGTGLSFVYKLTDKILISPEMNFNFRNSIDNNNSFIVKYHINESKSLDIFITNALGIQDMSQLIKSKDLRIGLKYNLKI